MAVLGTRRCPKTLLLWGVLAWFACFAKDPSCWIRDNNFTEENCCSSPDDTYCFDFSFTYERCCLGPRPPKSLLPMRLSLGVMASRSLRSLRSCWPHETPAASYDRCCGIGTFAVVARECWLVYDATGFRTQSFDQCCFPVISEGLDHCAKDAGDWCNDRQIGWLYTGVVGWHMELDHRVYVGPGRTKKYWESVSEEEFNFMLEVVGVQPATRVLELGCGSLRLGRLLIPYLDLGCYYGLDKSRKLMEAGWALELDDVARARQPTFVVSDRFELELFSRLPPPDVSIANSLLTHLNHTDIVGLLSKLGRLTAWSSVPHRFYATVRIAPDADVYAQAPSLASGRFYYSKQQFRDMALRTGWRVVFPDFKGTSFTRLGELERKQQMILFEAQAKA